MITSFTGHPNAGMSYADSPAKNETPCVVAHPEASGLGVCTPNKTAVVDLYIVSYVNAWNKLVEVDALPWGVASLLMQNLLHGNDISASLVFVRQCGGHL